MAAYLSAAAMSSSGVYGLVTGPCIVATDGRSLEPLLFCSLFAGCLAMLLRARADERINLSLAAGAVIGARLAVTLGVRIDAGAEPLLAPACVCLATIALPRVAAVLTRHERPLATEGDRSSCDEARLAELGLSAGERRAVELALTGMTSSQAAVLMGVKPPTVRSYLQRAYKKADVGPFGELKQLLAGCAVGSSAREESREEPRVFPAVLIPLVTGAVCLLPSSQIGLLTSNLYAWVSAGMLLWLALGRTRQRTAGALGALSSTMVGGIFVLAGADPTIGWGVVCSVVLGVNVPTLSFCTIASAACFCDGRLAPSNFRRADFGICSGLSLALLVVSSRSPIFRGALVCAAGVALFLPMAAKNREACCAELPQRRSDITARIPAAFYMGVVACDASMSFYLYLSTFDQAIPVFDFKGGDGFGYSYARGTGSDVVNVEGKSALNVKSIQVNKAAFEFYGLAVDGGSLPRWDEVDWSEARLPVLLGAAYKGTYSLGDSAEGCLYGCARRLRWLGF